MTMEDVAPKGQKSTGRGVSPCERADSEQSAEGATDAITLTPFRVCSVLYVRAAYGLEIIFIIRV